MFNIHKHIPCEINAGHSVTKTGRVYMELINGSSWHVGGYRNFTKSSWNLVLCSGVQYFSFRQLLISPSMQHLIPSLHVMNELCKEIFTVCSLGMHCTLSFLLCFIIILNIILLDLHRLSKYFFI
jgi:hypothetical protein